MTDLRGLIDITGSRLRPGSSQIFASQAPQPGYYLSNGQYVTPGGASSGSGGAGSAGSYGSAGLPSSIPAPTLKPFQFSTESQSYPTYLRNLGEKQAQRRFQSARNRIGMGNSAQSYMHALDQLNLDRLGFMAQAGQEELGVQKALQSEQDFYNNLLAELFRTQVYQRGQDVGYAESSLRNQTNREINSPVLSLGGGNSQARTSTTRTLGSGTMPSNIRSYLDAGYRRGGF